MAYLTKYLVATLLPALSLANSLYASDCPSQTPTARTLNGTYAGTYLSGFHQELFVGIPYAQPPVSDLRYRPPQALNTTWTGIRNATVLPNACPQYPIADGITELGVEMNEDCLGLNIVKPAGDVAGLPVLVWIHGGSYQNGYSALPFYNMSYMVNESVAMGKPIIGVSINYRLAFFGFLASTEILNSGNTNLGLKDQRQAFKWIQDNISAFGGDKNKVTIWGESAGAMSVGSHLFSYGGDNAGLWRAAILESGGATVDAYNSTNYYQPLYDSYVDQLNCSQAIDTLDCLRYVPYDALYAALNETGNDVYRFDYMPIIDGDMLREWPSVAMLAGRTANVPIITGSVTDEGTLFCPTGINTTEQLREYLLYSNQYKLSSSTVERLIELYPDNNAAGSPFFTGIETFPDLGLQFKRIASMLGDYLLIAANRFNAETSVAQHRDTWAYRFDIQPTANPAEYGVHHATDIPFAFYVPPDTLDPVSAVFYYSVLTPAQKKASQFMSRSFIAFAHDLSPVGTGLEGFPVWPKYNVNAANMVIAKNCSVEKDDFRKEGISFINEHLLEFVS